MMTSSSSLLHVQRLLDLASVLLTLVHSRDAVSQLLALVLVSVVSLILAVTSPATTSWTVSSLVSISLVTLCCFTFGNDIVEAHAQVLLVLLVRGCESFALGLRISLPYAVALLDDLQR